MNGHYSSCPPEFELTVGDVICDNVWIGAHKLVIRFGRGEIILIDPYKIKEESAFGASFIQGEIY